MQGPGRAWRRALAPALAASLGSVIALFVAYETFAKVDVLGSLSGLRPSFLALALLLHAVALTASATRCTILARGLGSPLRPFHALEIVLVGAFAGSITPSRLGSDPARFFLLARDAHLLQRGGASAVVFTERLMDILFYLAGGLLASLLVVAPLRRNGLLEFLLPIALGFIVLLLAALLLVAFNPRLLVPLAVGVRRVLGRVDQASVARFRERLEIEIESFQNSVALLVRRAPRSMLAGVVATVVFWIAEMMVFYVLLRGLGADVHAGPVILTGLLLNILMTVPLLPGGSGIAEVGAMALFGALVAGLSPAFVLAWRGTTYYVDLLVGGYATARVTSLEAVRALTAPRR